MTGLRELRPFGHTSWAAPFDDAPLRLSSAEAAPLTTGELCALAGTDVATVLANVPLGYEPSGGTHALRAAIAAGLPGVDADGVVVTTGAGEALTALAAVLLRPGDHAVLGWPAPECLVVALERCGCEATTVGPPFDADEIIALVGPSTRAVLLSSPHNPTGRVVDASALRRIAEALDRVGGVLVVDEVFRGIAVGGAVQPPAAALAPNAVTVGGLSKVSGLAGLRIGWVAGPPLLVDDVRGHHAAASRCPAAASQALALLALEHLELLLRRTNHLVHDNLQHLAALIDRHPSCRLDVPEGGTLAFPAVPVDDADAWCTRLALDHGLLVAPGPACFGIPGRVRLNLAAERSYWRAALPLLDAELAEAVGGPPW
jgi:aspartate/methionine/tyrosine aminotransferase